MDVFHVKWICVKFIHFMADVFVYYFVIVGFISFHQLYVD